MKDLLKRLLASNFEASAIARSDIHNSNSRFGSPDSAVDATIAELAGGGLSAALRSLSRQSCDARSGPSVTSGDVVRLRRGSTHERDYERTGSGPLAYPARFARGNLTGQKFGAQALMAGHCTVTPPLSLAGAAFNGWGANLENWRYQPDPEISAAQLERLEMKWVFGFHGAVASFGQPTIAGNRIFVGSQNAHVYSLDVYGPAAITGTMQRAPVCELRLRSRRSGIAASRCSAIVVGMRTLSTPQPAGRFGKRRLRTPPTRRLPAHLRCLRDGSRCRSRSTMIVLP